MCCRQACRRATWAAVLAMDAGYNNVMVYKQGAFGWRLSSRVKAYPSYEEGDPPPMAKVREIADGSPKRQRPSNGAEGKGHEDADDRHVP